MREETYILRIAIDGKITETARASSGEAIDTLIRDSVKEMGEHGYAKTRVYKVRIDKKHLTTYTIEYTRR